MGINQELSVYKRRTRGNQPQPQLHTIESVEEETKHPGADLSYQNVTPGQAYMEASSSSEVCGGGESSKENNSNSDESFYKIEQ